MTSRAADCPFSSNTPFSLGLPVFFHPKLNPNSSLQPSLAFLSHVLLLLHYLLSKPMHANRIYQEPLATQRSLQVSFSSNWTHSFEHNVITDSVSKRVLFCVWRVEGEAVVARTCSHTHWSALLALLLTSTFPSTAHSLRRLLPARQTPVLAKRSLPLYQSIWRAKRVPRKRFIWPGAYVVSTYPFPRSQWSSHSCSGEHDVTVFRVWRCGKR